jgi:glucose/arabinose dehydrogenase
VVVTAVLSASPAIVSVVASAQAPTAAAVVPSEVPAGFQDLEVIPGISEPTSVAFAPNGTAFIALKTGLVKSFDYDAGTGQFEPFASHTNVINLDTVVNNYHDRGLTGIAVDPQFGTAGHNFIYLNYAYDRDPRDNPAIVPKWGPGEGQYDGCAAPASVGPPVVTGCVAVTRVSRVPVSLGTKGWVSSGAEQPLVDLPAGQAACQQFGSHASGDVIFGPDGMLYASAGDGASFDTEDYGQAGNPCGDPVNEGGALRAQDLRTSADPLGLGGTIFRINPDGGQVPAGTQANASRIVTYGQRNPWRLTFRPGTNELWSGDVGASGWEEVNRTDMSTFTGPVNLGWPCYEGAYTGVQKQPGWDALDKPICENLYAAEAATPGTVQPPVFSYRTRGAGLLTPNENCEEGTSGISGVAFIPATSSYPTQYRGAMFFNDFARSCIWYLGKKANGDPDPTSITPFVQRAETPVQIKVGPGGDLYYVDYGIVDGHVTPGAGGIHRIVYTTGNKQPVAAVTATPSSGPAPLAVSFDAGGSADPDGDPLTYAWDLDGDGAYDDGTGATQSRTYTAPGNVVVSVQVSDGRGGSDTESVTVSPGGSPPQITSVTPDSSFTWAAGTSVTFTGDATDAQETLPASAYSWSVTLQHCPSVCHTHPLTGGIGKSFTFSAPDHEYPSNLLVTLTVTDAQGLTDVESVQIDPKPVTMTFATNPPGGAMTVAGAEVLSGHSQTFIVGHSLNVAVPETRTYNGSTYVFSSWSDGGARSHAVVAPASAATLTANYVQQTTTPNQPPTGYAYSSPGEPKQAPLTTTVYAVFSDPEGAALTYAWDLDEDGQFDDGGTTASQPATFTKVGVNRVFVRATDPTGARGTAFATINVLNTNPTVSLAADPASGPAPFTSTLTATASDPDGTALTYAWDLDADGEYDDGGTTATQSVSFSTTGTRQVGVRVTDANSGTATAATTLTVTGSTGGNTAPVLGTVVPAAGTTWAVGSTINLSATATDAQETLPSSAYTWTLQRVACASGCAPVQVGGAVTGQTGSFTAPDVPYPTYLLVTLTVTDSGGLTATRTVRLDPRTVRLDFTSSPGGLNVGPSRTVTAGSSVQITAPLQVTKAGKTYEFVRWSDGGARTHIVQPTVNTVYQATYVRVRAQVAFVTRPRGLRLEVDGATRVGPWARTYDVGERVRVSAPRRQSSDGVRYRFVRWSDGGARVHDVVVSESQPKVVAVYRRLD